MNDKVQNELWRGSPAQLKKKIRGNYTCISQCCEGLIILSQHMETSIFFNIFVQDCNHRTENDHVTSPGGLSKQDAQRLTPSFGFATL